MKDLSYYIYFKKLYKGQSGSALLGLIVTMVFLSALAAVMIAQTTTGSLGFVNENSSLRAYYLAESGFRYAPAKLKHKASLDDLHNHGSFSLGDKGSITLEFTTYIFEVTGGIGTNELVTRASFGKAPILENNPGYLKVGDNSVQAFDAVTIDACPNDNTVRFTSTQIWNDVFVGESVKLVVKSNGDAVSEGGDLNLQAGSSDAFPLYNGRFKADGKTYQYKRRETDKLVGITRVDSSTWAAPSLSNGDDIVLQAFAQLTSTGTYGEGDMAVSREIVYNIPVSTSEKAEFHDTFDSKDDWEKVSTLGTHEIETIGGDSVLKVTGTTSIGTDEGSLIKIDSSTVDAMLEWAHASAWNFLSYDTQVKVGFDPSVPSTYMAGISFRQDAEDSLGTSTGNSYGVSFLKAGSSDGIPDDLCPDFDTNIIENVSLLVLWQQTNSGVDKKWLVYKELIGRPVYLDTEKDGWDDWLAKVCVDPCLTPWPGCEPSCYSDVLWHIESRNNRNGHTAQYWYYGYYDHDPNGDYHTGTKANCGVIESPSIILPIDTNPFLSFWSWYETELPTTWDKKLVQISTDGGTSWITLDQLAPPDEVDDTDADNDYFTLVGWDTDNTDLDSVNGEGIFGTGKELDAIIRLNALTTSTGTFTDTEIGLHTFGTYSTRVYFDDFGLQTVVPTPEGFLPAIQQ